MSKKCFKCGEIKNLSEFYKHSGMADGHLNKCKECTKKDTKNRSREKHNLILEYDRKRNSLPERILKRKEYIKNNPQIKYKIIKNYREKYPEKIRAVAAVRRAVKNNILIKTPCQQCGALKVEAHHCDYSRPLDVIWLCNQHHREIHGNFRH